MKPVKFGKTFTKHYKARIQSQLKLSKQYDERCRLFLIGNHGHPINDHALSGSKYGQRAFSISGDIRVVYRETEAAIIFLDIGAHSQVY